MNAENEMVDPNRSFNFTYNSGKEFSVCEAYLVFHFLFRLGV